MELIPWCLTWDFKLQKQSTTDTVIPCNNKSFMPGRNVTLQMPGRNVTLQMIWMKIINI